MNFLEMLKLSQQVDEEELKRYKAKIGPYTGDGCPNCGRIRMMLGEDGKHRCEKCGWCEEDEQYDADLVN